MIHGRQDRVVPEEEVEYLAAGISGAALALIEEAGHCAPIEQPQAFTAVMRLWLTRPRSGGVVKHQSEREPHA